MSQQDTGSVWQSLVDILSQSTSETNLSMYIRQMRPVKIEQDTLIAEVYSTSLKTAIDQTFLPIMTGILRDITKNGAFRMEVRVSEPPAQKPEGKRERYATESLFPEEGEKGKEEEPFETNLSKDKRFDNFVVGNSNRFATAAAQAVAHQPGTVYNPLFIYGESGLGKTHLMQAAGNALLEEHPQAKVKYITCEAFTNEMIDSIKNATIMKFQQKYRTIDCLIIDDIQFLENKTRTQEEFFHTFNALREANKQIIISSDRSPQYLDKLEDRLRTRFANGLTIDIQSPDLETRIAILRQKAEAQHARLPNEVIQLIASNVEGNVRVMEGVLTRIIAYASLMNGNIDEATTERVLEEFGSSIHPDVTTEVIIDYICKHYEIKMEDMLGKKRTKNIAVPRQIAMYLCRTMTDTSLPRIGSQFGGRDHTTVMHAMDHIEKMRSEDKFFDQKLKQFERDIRKGNN